MLLFFKFYPPKSPQTLNIPKISLYIQIPQYMFCWWGWRNNNLSVTIMLPHLYHTHTHCVSTLIASIIYKLQYLYSYTRESTAALLINYTFGQYLFIYFYLSQMRQPRYPIDRIIYSTGLWPFISGKVCARALIGPNYMDIGHPSLIGQNVCTSGSHWSESIGVMLFQVETFMAVHCVQHFLCSLLGQNVFRIHIDLRF